MGCGRCRGAGLTWATPRLMPSSGRSGRSQALTLVPRSGTPATSHEIQGVGFFAEDEIPDLSMTRIVPAQIARMFEHYRDPDLPADFD